MEQELACLDRGNPPREGRIDYRMIGGARAFARCEAHFRKRLVKQAEIDRRYAPNSSCPPKGFDPADAGERWDDDY